MSIIGISDWLGVLLYVRSAKEQNERPKIRRKDDYRHWSGGATSVERDAYSLQDSVQILQRWTIMMRLYRRQLLH